MAVIVNPSIARDAYISNSDMLSSVSLYTKHAGRIVDGASSVKMELDKLFNEFAARKGYRLFDTVGDHEFTVPEGVYRVLAMVISAGQDTNANQGGAVMISRYCAVTPNQIINVKVGNRQGKQVSSTYNKCGSAFGTYIRTFHRGQYWIDEKSYTFFQPEHVFPPEGARWAHLQCCVTFANYINTSGSAGPGMGGFSIPDDTVDVRQAWLEIARDTPVEKKVSRRCCYSDSTKCGTAASSYYSGNGAGYGGVAGRVANGQGYAKYAGTGTQGFVAVFWGDDIGGPVYISSDPAFYRKDSDTAITPISLLADSEAISYYNDNVSLPANNVKEALAELRKRAENV